MPDRPWQGDACSLVDEYRAGRRSPLEELNATLDAISTSRLNAFCHLDIESAQRAAAAADVTKPFGGVPIGIKELDAVAGWPDTGASVVFRDRTATHTSTMVARVARDGGAVPIGQTTSSEFGMVNLTRTELHGATHNPWRHGTTPGGSSGGSAVAVAADFSPASLGSDTGGSIRQPASFTGVVGLKPTYGRVSRFGLVAFASSLDQIGPFASDVRGAARVLSVIGGHDGRDTTSLALPLPDLEAACGADVRGKRLGVPEEYFAEGLDAHVEASVRAAIRALEDAGCTVHPISLPHTRYAVATYYVIATAEASSNLARFDGVRFGLRVEGASRDTKQASALRAMYGATRDAGFGPEVKRRILLGTFVLSAGYYDAYYVKAQRVRTLVRRDFEKAFAEVDAIVCPTSPTPAFALGEKTSDPLSMYLADVYTLPASLAGLPAISVPAPPTPAGLPVGLQIIGRPLDEPTVLALASAWEARR